MLYDPITLTEALIKCRSVTPKNDGAIELVSQWLEELNLECKILDFEGEDSSAVKNLSTYLAQIWRSSFTGRLVSAAMASNIIFSMTCASLNVL